MTSQINPDVPVFGAPSTASVRNNFLIAKNEIEALQSLIGGNAGGGFGSPIIVNAGGTVVIPSPLNYFILINNTSGAPITVTLPVGVIIGQQLVVKDNGGNAGTYNITLASPNTIDGNATYPLVSNFASVSLFWTGSQWGTF